MNQFEISHSKIFLNIKQIFNVNVQFLESLESMQEPDNVGSVYLSFVITFYDRLIGLIAIRNIAGACILHRTICKNAEKETLRFKVFCSLVIL